MNKRFLSLLFGIGLCILLFLILRSGNTISPIPDSSGLYITFHTISPTRMATPSGTFKIVPTKTRSILPGASSSARTLQ